MYANVTFAAAINILVGNYHAAEKMAKQTPHHINLYWSIDDPDTNLSAEIIAILRYSPTLTLYGITSHEHFTKVYTLAKQKVIHAGHVYIWHIDDVGVAIQITADDVALLE